MNRGVLAFGFLLLSFVFSPQKTVAQEVVTKHRYRMSQLEGLVEEPVFEDSRATRENETLLQPFSGAEEVNEQGVVIRTQSVHTSDIVSQLKNTPLGNVNVKVRNTDQLLDQVTSGASYYLQQVGTENPVTVHESKP